MTPSDRDAFLAAAAKAFDEFTAAQPAVLGVPASSLPSSSAPTTPLSPGYQWGQNAKTGEWQPVFIGIPGNDDHQAFIDAGGSAGQIANFDIFVANSHYAAGVPFATKYADYVASQAAAHQAASTADTPGDYGTSWRSYSPNLVDAIDKNFADLLANHGVNWAYNYLCFAAPQRPPLRYFSRQLGVTIVTCFRYASPEKALRDSLHLADDEGYAGAPSIANGQFTIQTAAGPVSQPLPYGELVYNTVTDPTL